MALDKKYPQYFEMDDDYYVKIDYDPATDEVYGETAGGQPFPMAKARFEGTPTTAEKFNERVSQLKDRPSAPPPGTA